MILPERVFGNESVQCSTSGVAIDRSTHPVFHFFVKSQVGNSPSFSVMCANCWPHYHEECPQSLLLQFYRMPLAPIQSQQLMRYLINVKHVIHTTSNPVVTVFITTSATTGKVHAFKGREVSRFKRHDRHERYAFVLAKSQESQGCRQSPSRCCPLSTSASCNNRRMDSR